MVSGFHKMTCDVFLLSVCAGMVCLELSIYICIEGLLNSFVKISGPQ